MSNNQSNHEKEGKTSDIQPEQLAQVHTQSNQLSIDVNDHNYPRRRGLGYVDVYSAKQNGLWYDPAWILNNLYNEDLSHIQEEIVHEGPLSLFRDKRVQVQLKNSLPLQVPVIYTYLIHDVNKTR